MDESNLKEAVVSLVTNRHGNTTNYMTLRQYHREGLRYNFTLCMGGPWFGMVSPHWFVEWMEMNMVFGAEKVLIHNMSMSKELDRYVDVYARRGLVEVLPWSIHPVIIKAGTTLQSTVIMNCLYRMRRRTVYMAQFDQDELIVPRHPDDVTWSDMIKRSGCKAGPYTYGARQLYFGLTYSHNIRNRNNTGFMTLDETQRSAEVLAYPARGKYIVNTFKTGFIGIHRAYGPRGVQGCTLPVTIGANHHYRKRLLFYEKNGVVIDNSTFKYRDILTKRVRHTMSMAENVPIP